MRGISLTYGQTTIDGGFIRTGEISSLDNATKFNLNTGYISGRITFAAGSSGYANISDKPALGSLSGLNIVELAQLGTTVITGGYLATSLIDANYIRTIDLIATKVTTGKLQSVNTLNYFDLDNNQFKLGNATNYMDWNVTTPNVLTIKGHITADSGTISGVTINANDQFSLNGSKVEIFPNAGIRVFGSGYADFTNSTLKVPTVAASGLASGEAALWIGSLSGVASGASGGSVATLSDVALSSLATGQILVWNGATWVNQNNVAAVDLSAYYTKTETQNFFSGASAMSGYNKSNWDSAYAYSTTPRLALTGGTLTGPLSGTSASFGSATPDSKFNVFTSGVYGLRIGYSGGTDNYLDGATNYIRDEVGTTRLQIGTTAILSIHLTGTTATFSGTVTAPTFSGALSGTASNATSWNGTTHYFGSGIYSSTSGYSVVIHDGSQLARVNAAGIQGFLGLGSAAYTASSAYYAASSTVANSTLWLGMAYVGSDTTVNTYMLGYGSDGSWHPIGVANLRSFLGIPSGGDTLASVTGRGASTSTMATFSGGITVPTWIYQSGFYGLYNSSYTGHFYQRNTAYWAVTGSASTTYGGIQMMQTHESGSKGYLYWDSAGIGLLNDAGGWTIRGNYGTGYGGTLYGSWNIQTAASIGTGTADSKLNVFTSGVYGLRIGYSGGTDNYYDGANHYFRSASGASYMEVNGSRLLVNSVIHSLGDVIAYYTSDKFLKDNIRPIAKALSKVNQLSGNYFEWNALQDTYEVGSTDIGVIAQEVEAVFPELVITRDNGFKAVKYEKLVPVLIEAIKELSTKVRRLEGRIN
ncbi:MAG: tail fiber domain-containing protein [Legionellaceae bacterium]|nr:tail fiber domain-containing protein [Legionellaceae bacterium]